MANPAELLYNNLVQWNPPNSSTQTAPENFRGLKTNRDHALHMHEIALGYIAQIRELLDTLGQLTGLDVDEYREELPNWTALVISYPNGWQSAVQFNTVSMRSLKTLRGLLKGVVPAEALLRETQAVAARLATRSPVAVREVKRLIYAATDRPLASGLDHELAAFLSTGSTAFAKRAFGKIAADHKTYAESPFVANPEPWIDGRRLQRPDRVLRRATHAEVRVRQEGRAALRRRSDARAAVR